MTHIHRVKEDCHTRRATNDNDKDNSISSSSSSGSRRHRTAPAAAAAPPPSPPPAPAPAPAPQAAAAAATTTSTTIVAAAAVYNVLAASAVRPCEDEVRELCPCPATREIEAWNFRCLAACFLTGWPRVLYQDVSPRGSGESRLVCFTLRYWAVMLADGLGWFRG